MPVDKLTAMPYGPPPLPAGTPVKHRAGGHLGVVVQYDPTWTRGIFPVRWSISGTYELMTADEVIRVEAQPRTRVR